MPLDIGDKVFVRRREPRVDDKKTYISLTGKVVDAFNACDDSGDHWRYKVKDDLGHFVLFYEGIDEGEITLIEKKDDTNHPVHLSSSWFHPGSNRS